MWKLLIAFELVTLVFCLPFGHHHHGHHGHGFHHRHQGHGFHHGHGSHRGHGHVQRHHQGENNCGGKLFYR